jgi:hypothetical protein
MKQKPQLFLPPQLPEMAHSTYTSQISNTTLVWLVEKKILRNQPCNHAY